MTTADAFSRRGFTAKGLATRDKILRSAADVLLSGGLTDFNLDKVRQAASVSGSQLNHYFGDRNDLIRAVVRRQSDIVLDFHRQPKLHGLDTFEDWERWADLNLRYLRKIGYRGTATYHALAGQLAKTNPEMRASFADGYWRWVALLEDCFARMRSQGRLIAATDPRQLALTVVALHQGAGLLTFTYRQEWPLVEATRAAVNCVRLFAKDPAERTPRRARRSRVHPVTNPPPEPQTPRFTRKGMATRARIIEGAAELILQRGVSGTSLEDVREALGVSGSQLSHYFVDKRDLVRQVIAARTDFMVDFHTQPLLGQLDSLKDLRKWADMCWAVAGDDYLRNGCVYGSLSSELLEADDLVLDDLARGYDRWLALHRDGLSVMGESHELSDLADPRHLAVTLVVAHQGSTLLTHVTGSAEPFRAAIDTVLRYVGSFSVATKESRPQNRRVPSARPDRRATPARRTRTSQHL